MNQKGSSETSREAGSDAKEGQGFVVGLWGVRYQVKDVSRSIEFYTKRLGFKLDQQNPPAFAQVSVGNLKLVLSGPGASGSRPMPDGRQQEPGGWNRVMLQVSDLAAHIEPLKKAGVHFRNEMEVGPGGKQIQLEDPDGNPLELFEPARSPTIGQRDASACGHAAGYPLVIACGREVERRIFMKTTLMTLLAALVAASGLALAQYQQPSPASPKITAEQQAMMAAFQKAATVGPNHKLLQSLVGEWGYTMKAWMNPAEKPEEGSGSTSFRSLMDGRFVQHEHKGTFMGMPYHGIGLLGYDNVTKQFQLHFFENVKSSQMMMHGSYDVASKMFTFRGEMVDILKPGTKVKVRETVRMPDPNTQILEWYETRGGKETKTMEITYKREK